MRSPQVIASSPPQAAGPSLPVARLAGFRGTRFWTIPLVMLGLVLVVVVLLATTDPDTRAAVSGLAQTLAMFFAAALSVWVSFRVPAGRGQWAWRVIAFAQILYIIANALLVASPPATNSLQASSYVSVALFLSFYAFLALGVLMLPTVQTTFARYVRLLLDVGIVVGALLGPSLVFLIVPRFLSSNPLDVVYIGYPFADLALLLVAALQLVRGVQQTYRPAFFWLMLGMLCLVYADISFNIVTLPIFSQGGSPSFGIPWIDPFWVAGLFAFALAPFSLLVQGGEREAWPWLEALAARLGRMQPSRTVMQFLLLALPVLLLFGLIIFTLVNSQNLDAMVPLVIVSMLVVLLIIVRQLLTMRDLVDARIATERAQQLDALKDQFITSVNHELRTPLMTMQGYIHLLAEPEGQLAAPEKRADMVDRAKHACENLVQLVRSILDTRRIEQEAANFIPEVVSVREAAQAALSLIDPHEADPSGRQLHLQIPVDLTIWGDPVRVQQILTNLLSNAIKYSAPNAPITVAAQVVAEKGPRFLNLPRPDGHQHWVEITVQDRGLGIPPAQKELLFRRFVRLPREIASNVHGTGLGLYLCRVFTEAMGGMIWVESSGVSGEGSCFHVRLPVPVPAQVQALAAQAT